MLKHFILLFLIPCNLLAATVDRKDVNFTINPERLTTNTEFGLAFYSYKDHMPSVVKDFDIENFRKGKNELIYSKSAFLLNKNIDDINRDEFLDGESLAPVFDAQLLRRTASNSWEYRMTVIIKTIEFRLSAFVGNSFSENATVASYTDASEGLDYQLDSAEYYVSQLLDKFNSGVKRMIIVSKIIPYGNQTLVVTYHLSALDYKWFKKYNIFNAAKKVFKKRVLATLERTKQRMLR